MSDRGALLVIEEPDDGDPVGKPQVRRDRDLLGRRPRRNRDEGSVLGGIRGKLDEAFDRIARGFEDQSERSDIIEDCWDAYKCISNSNRYYTGIADIYVPIIRDACNAIVTRSGNQLFPQTGRCVEVISADGSIPRSEIALMEHYLRERQFETMVARPLLLNGLIEGQMNLCLDWEWIRRQLVSRETHGPEVEGMEVPGEEMEDVVVEEVEIGMPVYEVLHDSDVLILPQTADTVEEALQSGGSITMARRWTKAKIDRMVKDGCIRKEEAKELKDEMRKVAASGKDIEKHLVEHVGIQLKGERALVWETWMMLPLDEDGDYDEDGEPRLCRIFFGPNRVPLGAKRNPYWNDRCPLLSVAVRKVAGVAKGESLVAPMLSIQYEANDAVNEGADAATLSAGPMVVRDPARSNGPIVYNIGAIIDAPPDAIKLLEFPDLTPRALQRVQMAYQTVFQSLSVNPSMLPQQTRAGKPTQAQIAQEQQVDLLTTSEMVKVPAEGILTPTLGWTADLDYQFRDSDITIRAFGEMGIRAEMEVVEPLVNRAGMTFIWRGGEQVKMNQMIQQQGTQLLNVLQNPNIQQLLGKAGFALDPVPFIIAQTQAVLGSYIGSSVVIDQRHLLTVDPETENDILAEGQDMHVHPLDDDPRHLQAHQQARQATGDPHGTIMAHIGLHIQSMAMKNAASMQRSQAQQGLPPPGGGGQPRGPQQGAVPGQMHAAKAPPGQLHPDRMARAGVVAMPRSRPM